MCRESYYYCLIGFNYNVEVGNEASCKGGSITKLKANLIHALFLLGTPVGSPETLESEQIMRCLDLSILRCSGFFSLKLQGLFGQGPEVARSLCLKLALWDTTWGMMSVEYGTPSASGPM